MRKLDENVANLLSAGETEPTLVSIKTGQPLRLVEEQVEEATTPQTNMQILKKELADALHMCGLSKDEYESNPSMYTANAYTGILKEVQSLIDRIEQLGTMEESANEVLRIMQHFCRNVIKITGEGFSFVRGKCDKRVHADINEAFKNMAQSIEREYRLKSVKIQKALGVDDMIIPTIDVDEARKRIGDPGK